MITIKNKYAAKVYKYIYIHDGETILNKDIMEFTGFCQDTVIKYIHWLEKRELILKRGKHYEIIN